MLKIEWIILGVIGIIVVYIVLKTFIVEIIKNGIKGLFTSLPKALIKLLKLIFIFVKKILGFIFNFLKSFLKALKICIRGV